MADTDDPGQQELLPDLARFVSRTELSLDDLLDFVFQRLRPQVGLHRAVLLLREHADSPWAIAASAGPQSSPWGDRDLTAHAEALMAVASGSAALPMDDPVPTDEAADRADRADRADATLGDGTGCLLVTPLRTAGTQVGVLVLVGAHPGTQPEVDPGVLVGVTLCLATAVNRDIDRRDREFFERSTRAIRRLFEEGARVGSVEEAGEVLARVAAEAFETERAGMYVTDSAGLISFAVGVGISADLSSALSRSLVGKVAADSPVWQVLERNAGPSLVGVASQAALRPGGFVQTLQFKSYVAIPLLSDVGPLGMVICGDASRERTWSAREADLAKQFALEGALIVDAARLREAERAQLAEITYQAFHDRLTGLPNRALFLDRAQQALALALRNRTGLAMLLMDLDNFKQVNDTLGHHYGDVLLQKLSKCISGMLRETDSVARLGGDEFAILVTGNAGRDEAIAVARKLETQVSVPIDLDGISLQVVPSIGIALFPDHGPDARALLRSADIAMYTAKRSGAGPTMYDPSQYRSTLDKLTLFTELRQAIENDELRLHYQPKLDLATGLIAGVEALVRWQHPRRGLLGPGEFLSVAESTGLIDPLTEWVLTAAVAQWSQWNRADLHIDLAVNVSARNLLNPGFFGRLATLVDGSAIARHLIVEITETAVMLEPDRAAQRLADLRNAGVRVSMDDFGSGYSSLTQLRRLPLDELKIDRMLVNNVAANDLDVAVIETIVGLGHRLGLSVVSEGVEDERTLDVVRRLGCDQAQGFFIAAPMPPESVTEFVYAHSSAAPANSSDAATVPHEWERSA